MFSSIQRTSRSASPVQLRPSPKVLGSVLLSLGSVLLLSCSGATPSQSAQTPSEPELTTTSGVTTGDELVEAAAPHDLAGAAPALPEAEVPDDITNLTARMTPRVLSIPPTNRGTTSKFTFDGHRRGWFARTPGGRQALLTPVYGEGKVYVGGGFSSHQLFAYSARTGEREWRASAPDGGPSAAIYEGGKVIFNTESCTLFAVDGATGRRVWSRWLGDPLMSQPAANESMVFSGHIIDARSPGGLQPGTTGFGVGSGRRYGFTALDLNTGRERWTRRIAADVMNAPVVDDAAGNVVFTTMDGTVYSMDQATGRQRWRRRLDATSAPSIDGDKIHVTVREGRGDERSERALVLSKSSGETLAEYDSVPAVFATRPDTGVQHGWAYEGSRATVVDGRSYQTIGNEVQSRDADTGELLWTRRYADVPPSAGSRPASPPAIAGSQLVFGTQSGVLFGLDIDTGMTTWAYDVGEPIVTQPTIAHGWVYASTQRGGVVALEVSDSTLDGWHQWGGNASHTGAVTGTSPPVEEDERPSEGTMQLDEDARAGEVPGFPLTGTRVTARVDGFITRVEVEQTFTNPYDRPVEAVYLFPLPDDAAVDAMELRNGDRVIRAQIRRRRDAREEYEAARSNGQLASLLEQERPNLFRQSVANLKPGSTIRVALTYTQVLPYEEGSYRFVYPLVAGPRFDEDSATAGSIQQVALAPGAERPDRVDITIDAGLGVAVHSVSSPTHSIKTEEENGRHKIELDEAARPDRDFEVRFAVAGEVPTVGVTASAPQSADERGHFAMAVHPSLNVSESDVMPRELVFVVDTSSSMQGRPMELAKAAMRTAIRGLRRTDTFRVLSFADQTESLAEAPLDANEANKERGLAFVDDMRALGRTRMVQGIEAALQPEAETGRLRFVVLMTDGYIARESEVFRAVHENLGQARVFGFGVGSAVNRYLLTRLAEVGRGDVQVVTLDESPEAAAEAFHARIARPYLTDIQIDWGELDVQDAYPRRLPDLFADRPLVVHGRYAQGGAGEVVIRGRVAGRAFEQRVHVELPEAGEERPALGSIWARTRIRDLMTAMALRPSDELREEVTLTGLRHHLLTEWTAFIAVDEQSIVDTPATTVQQPSQVPVGVAPPAQAAAEAPPVMAPAALYAPSTVSTMSTAQPMRRRARRRMPSRTTAGPSGGSAYQRCMEQARRPDGSIDQAALQSCLNASRKGASEEEKEAREGRRSPNAHAPSRARIRRRLTMPRRE
ncbi:MAG: Ca-activated chloride channel family protein [Polyangiales bacterium]|jgi:Ca-activated chloride channel family protein